MTKMTILALLISNIFLFNACDNENADQDKNTSTPVSQIDDTETEKTDEKGSVQVYIEARTDTTISAKTKVQSDAGIESITLYCINAYKYYEEGQVVVIDKKTKNFNSGETNLKFMEYKFTNLSPKKSYLIKSIAQTEAGEIKQQTTTATLPVERKKEAIDLGAFSIYHRTLPEYTFNLRTPTKIDILEIEEFDGDFELIDVLVEDASGRQVIIANNITSSGNNIAKIHTLNNPDKNMIVSAIIIRTHGNAGGLWQFNSILVNP